MRSNTVDSQLSYHPPQGGLKAISEKAHVENMALIRSISSKIDCTLILLTSGQT